ncbi:serine/threonine-protein kinase [Streptomyces boninensis]|uniref:serine/threonine-protein kinase n=1 Tax=Streptomyces boninensis TaxID=2039455 RepID=UPI003B21BBA5
MHGDRGRLIDGRFELLERLGSGGMGTVWRARDTALRREVALKEVRAADPALAAADPETQRMLRERVLREARALARLSHPNVVTIHHIVDADPHPWLVMELVPGGSLQDRLAARGPLDEATAARIGLDVLAALRAAHAAGIHHRDVKPGNVLLRADGSAVLTDFGIAALQGSDALTRPGDVIGSPEYIAPERIRGAPDHPAADLWSLGMLLYVLVEGISPLRRENTLATLAAVLDAPLPPPQRAGALAPVLQALLVRDPALRPDAERLAGMLRSAVATADGSGARATPPAYTPTALDSPRPAPPGGPRQRTALLVAAIALAMVLLGAMAAGFVLWAGGNDGGNGSGDDAKGSNSQQPRGKEPQDSKQQTTPAGDQPDKSTPPPKPSDTEPSGTGPSEPSPTRTDSDSRGWIAVLDSEKSKSVADSQLAKIRSSVPDARLLHSDNYASLNPGNWVVYSPGTFPDGHAVTAYCKKINRPSTSLCYGRYLSNNSADRNLYCPPEGGGICTRP